MLLLTYHMRKLKGDLMQFAANKNNEHCALANINPYIQEKPFL